MIVLRGMSGQLGGKAQGIAEDLRRQLGMLHSRRPHLWFSLYTLPILYLLERRGGGGSGREGMSFSVQSVPQLRQYVMPGCAAHFIYVCTNMFLCPSPTPPHTPAAPPPPRRCYAGQCSFPKAWEGYQACASYDLEHWFRWGRRLVCVCWGGGQEGS